MKFLFVVPRYGPGALGGAERLTQLIATRGIGADDTAEIATTCAVDNHTWSNELPSGTTIEDGLPVHRFLVGRRDLERHRSLHQRLITEGSLDYVEELELLAQGVWSPGLMDYLDRHGASFDLLFFVPYLFGTTYWGMQVHPERSVLIPCLHDEPYAYMQAIREMIESSAGCLFNTPAERCLAERICNPSAASAIVGLGFDPPQSPAIPGYARANNLERYLVYIGRLEEGKGVAIAADFVARYAREHDPGLRLLLVGSGPFTPSAETRPYVRSAGWLSEDDKRSAIADSVALINPSRMESLSIVLMESWLEGVPVLVSAGSEVMREHCALSGGGLTFRDYADFSGSLTRILEEPTLRTRLGEAGRAYVLDTMNWGMVRERFSSAIRLITAEAPIRQ